MKKKPTITLIRGNTPKLKTVVTPSVCWRCSTALAKNDKVFELPGTTQRNKHGGYYKADSKEYCLNCMKDNIARTEAELIKIKKMIGE